jgi:hypothetical protein
MVPLVGKILCFENQAPFGTIPLRGPRFKAEPAASILR